MIVLLIILSFAAGAFVAAKVVKTNRNRGRSLLEQRDADLFNYFADGGDLQMNRGEDSRHDPGKN